VPAVLPGFIAFALWAVAWATGMLRRGEVPGLARLAELLARMKERRRSLLAGGLASVCAIAFLVPTVISSFGLNVHHGGPAGVKVTANGLALKKVYQDQVAKVYGLCAQIPKNSSVVIVDGPLADRMAEVVRGMCDVPVGRYHDLDAYNDPTVPKQWIYAAIRGIQHVKRHPVLLAANPGELTFLLNKGPVHKAMTLRSTRDGQALVTKPMNLLPEDMDIWMWKPAR